MADLHEAVPPVNQSLSSLSSFLCQMLRKGLTAKRAIK